MSAFAEGVATTALESWIAKRLGVEQHTLSREILALYQLKALQKTVQWARSNSSFYVRHLANLSDDAPRSFAEFARLPFTTSEDLTHSAPEFLCVSQDAISRVVTLQTSGTSGTLKRIFFTEADQELALDFFANGIAAMAAPGDRMLISLPGEREGSVGYQLAKGIARAGVIPIPHGLSIDPAETLAHMGREKATCIIGLPVQMLALFSGNNECIEEVIRRLHSIVLCSDHVPESLMRRLRQKTGCEIFEHYGMTEMGLGGGVDCAAHMGYHMREADLYFEIVDPESGELLPDGETGAIVFTTFNRTGMPLIRYRTGDLSRFLPGPCRCGTMLKRLERVRGRVDGYLSLGKHGSINIGMLDEVLFSLPELLDFTATLVENTPRRMEITACAPGFDDAQIAAKVRDALRTLPVICHACTSGEVEISVVSTQKPFAASGAKRKIVTREKKGGERR